jgi:hypothetical protein
MQTEGVAVQQSIKQEGKNYFISSSENAHVTISRVLVVVSLLYLYARSF